MPRICRILFPILGAFDLGGLMALYLVPAANQWRGCYAIGGEWFLVLAAAWFGWQVGCWLADVCFPVRKHKKKARPCSEHEQAPKAEIA